MKLTRWLAVAVSLIFVAGCAKKTAPDVSPTEPTTEQRSPSNEPTKDISKTSEVEDKPTPVPEVTKSETPLNAPDDKPKPTPQPKSTKPKVDYITESPAETNPSFTVEADFTPLTFADFDSFAAEPETWTAQEDRIDCTGKPRGYLYSRQSYQNFTWRLEYRFLRPKSLPDEQKFKGNTGFLVYINGEPKLWPVCLEVQGKHIQMAAIKENGGASPVEAQDDEATREAARKPVGEWNALEIVSRDGALTVKLNDQIISRSEPNFLADGKIGIQSEDHPFVVRRMRIRAD